MYALDRSAESKYEPRDPTWRSFRNEWRLRILNGSGVTHLLASLVSMMRRNLPSAGSPLATTESGATHRTGVAADSSSIQPDANSSSIASLANECSGDPSTPTRFAGART